MSSNNNQFSASASALGYNYQQRYALYWLLSSPEEAECQIECDDDIDLTDETGQALASLKHKAVGDTLTDLSSDFWKSIRIWLTHYKKNPKATNKSRFCLFTTSLVSQESILRFFLPLAAIPDDFLGRLINKATDSKATIIQSVSADLKNLETEQIQDFFSRITIFDSEPRIDDLPAKIQSTYLKTVPSIYRSEVYRQLEGWWFDLTVEMMAGKRPEPVTGLEISEMLSYFAAQYRDDNLPIEFEYAEPSQKPDSQKDNRNFVKQLRAIGIGTERIERAIRDYYRASEQRGEWIRIDLKLDGELERYDDRLVDEWDRQREIVWECVCDDTSDNELNSLGSRLLNGLMTSDSERLRIRPRVTATFVVGGSYHILANEAVPKVHWHPKFKERVEEIFGGSEL